MSIEIVTTHRLDLRREAPEAYRALAALSRAATLEPTLTELVKLRVSQINGCAYCIDLHARLAREHGEDERRLYALSAWRESPFFTHRERAGLALAEALTLMAGGPVPDDLYAEAEEEMEPGEPAALLVVVAGINAWNRVMEASGALPPPLSDGAREGER